MTLNLNHYLVVSAYQMGRPVYRVTSRVAHDGPPEMADITDVNYFDSLKKANDWATMRRLCRFYTADVETFSAQAVQDAYAEAKQEKTPAPLY